MRKEVVTCDRCRCIEKPGPGMRIVHVKLITRTDELVGGWHEADLCYDCRSALDRLIAQFLGEGKMP